mmetsp:Transcript_77912/g.228441  ORF Transcript_77912/g.228441 Transcript_77912/m.228441 type:complete len:235 (+) Transcript_77912:101-805(+)
MDAGEASAAHALKVTVRMFVGEPWLEGFSRGRLDAPARSRCPWSSPSIDTSLLRISLPRLTVVAMDSLRNSSIRVSRRCTPLSFPSADGSRLRTSPAPSPNCRASSPPWGRMRAASSFSIFAICSIWRSIFWTASLIQPTIFMASDMETPLSWSFSSRACAWPMSSSACTGPRPSTAFMSSSAFSSLWSGSACSKLSATTGSFTQPRLDHSPRIIFLVCVHMSSVSSASAFTSL